MVLRGVSSEQMLDIFDLDRRNFVDQLWVAERDPSFEQLHRTRRRLFRNAYRASLLDVLFPLAELLSQFACFDKKVAQFSQRLTPGDRKPLARG